MNNLGMRCYVFGKDARREAKPNGHSIRKSRNAAKAPKATPAYAQVIHNES